MSLNQTRFEEELKSTVDEILQTCPKFRILVLGRSGVGKSRLINAIFGIEHTVVEHGRTAGVSNIEDEIASPQNPRLILHDSQGFSHGDAGNLELVMNFIDKRSRMADIKDRLHAIWLCTAVPTYGGSLLEIADEKIIQLKTRGIPIFAVFTKYDTLVESLIPPVPDEDLYGDIEEDLHNLAIGDDSDQDSDIGSDETALIESLFGAAQEKLNNEIVKPFEKILDVPWVAVSVKPRYAGTLEELIQKTLERIDQSLRVLWAITQQKSVDLKIDASIEVGKRRYWRGLSTSFQIPGRSLDKWLKVVHRDIVQIWGLYDPEMILTAAAKVMSELQIDLVDDRSGILQKLSLSGIAGAAAIISGIVPPAAPFAIPVAVSIVFSAWVYKAFEVTPNILRGMMGYIVDLTIVMQSLFLLMQARKEVDGPASLATNKLFNLALHAYTYNSEHSPQKVHDEIRSVATRVNALFKHGEVIAEVERIIKDHRFVPSEVSMAEARESSSSSSSI